YARRGRRYSLQFFRYYGRSRRSPGQRKVNVDPALHIAARARAGPRLRRSGKSRGLGRRVQIAESDRRRHRRGDCGIFARLRKEIGEPGLVLLVTAERRVLPRIRTREQAWARALSSVARKTSRIVRRRRGPRNRG